MESWCALSIPFFFSSLLSLFQFNPHSMALADMLMPVMESWHEAVFAFLSFLPLGLYQCLIIISIGSTSIPSLRSKSLNIFDWWALCSSPGPCILHCCGVALGDRFRLFTKANRSKMLIHGHFAALRVPAFCTVDSTVHNTWRAAKCPAINNFEPFALVME